MGQNTLNPLIATKLCRLPLLVFDSPLVEELKIQEGEIQLCLDDLQYLNDHIVDLTSEYEMMLKRLCELQGIKLPEEYNFD